MDTALARPEGEGLVARQGRDTAGRMLYALPDAGRAESHDWYTRPVERTGPPRDQPGIRPAIKQAMAVVTLGVEVRAVVETQRGHLGQALREYTRQRCAALARLSAHRDEVARLLVLEQLVLHAEGELLWLDHCEARLQRLAGAVDTRPPAGPDRGMRQGGSLAVGGTWLM